MRFLLLLLLLAAPARAAPFEEVFTAARIPGGPAGGLGIAFTKDYRGAVPHAAIAFSRGEDGRSAWAFVGGRASPEAAERDALARCQARAAGLPGAAPCQVLARDAAIPGGPEAAPVEGRIGPFRFSPFHARHGGAARGAVVWGHGYGGPERDLRDAALPGFLSALNEAGWDILRFDRHPGDDGLATSLPRLARALPALREAGYARIVLGGQSRGGWQAMLAAAEQPDLVAAVIATAPAAHGDAGRPNNHGAAPDDWRRALAALAATPVRLAVAVFEDDPFDPDPAGRARAVALLDEGREAPALAIWPRRPVAGHAGAGDWRFTRDHAACILTLVQAPAAGAPRGLRRDSCGGG
ncbi:alpha/beta hydrolase [Roseococcus sp. DSY-14]|uniref:alpha/beta hydrolase n=1 Tax=Roseococcus sp. DSY-14 TaxID=3369650 RepID=UPI00387B5409